VTRFALKLEYDGRGFVGWQRQSTGVSVQQVVENAAAHLFGGQMPSCVAAGRTDAGVHAAGQIVQIDLPDHLGTRAVREALNFHMRPYAVAVVAVGIINDTSWSARFSATAREYRYVILNRMARPALALGFVWHVKTPLDEGRMDVAGQSLIGLHDFTSFRATACQARSPLRTIDRLDVTRDGDRVIVRVGARSFLHHQVRNIVGSLKLVGQGKWPIDRIAAVLAARDRAAAGPTAPPDGLTLIDVRYPFDPFADQQ